MPRHEVARGRTEKGRGGTESAAVRTEKGNAASWQTRGERGAGQKKQRFGGGAATGRTLERRVGKTRQKIVARLLL